MENSDKLPAKLLPAAAYLVLGIMLVINPAFLDNVCRIAGAAMILGGIILIISGIAGKGKNSSTHLYMGIFIAFLGIFFEILPSFLNFLIPTIIGLVLAFNGFVRMRASYSSRNSSQQWIFGFIIAFLLVILGVIIIVNQNFFMNTVKWSLGASFIAASVINIISLIFTRIGKK